MNETKSRNQSKKADAPAEVRANKFTWLNKLTGFTEQFCRCGNVCIRNQYPNGDNCHFCQEVA